MSITLSSKQTAQPKKALALASVAGLALLASPLLLSSPVAAAPNDPINFLDAALKTCLLNDGIGNITVPGEITEAEAEAHTGFIDCSGRGITNLSGMSFFINAIAFDFSGNAGLTDASALSVTSAEQLYLNDTGITTLMPFAGSTTVELLDVSNTALTTLDGIEGMTALQEVNATNLSISSVTPLSALTNLIYVNVSHTNVTDFSPLPTQLVALTATHNGIDDVSSIVGLTNLQSLDLSNNSILDMSPISAIYLNLTGHDFSNQTVLLPSVTVNTATPNPVVRHNGDAPALTIDPASGTYDAVSSEYAWTVEGLLLTASWDDGLGFSGMFMQDSIAGSGGGATPGGDDDTITTSSENPVMLATVGGIAFLIVAGILFRNVRKIRSQQQ